MTLASIEIRTASPKDADDLAGVHETSWRYAYRGIVDGVTLERMIARRGPAWWARIIAGTRNMLVIDAAGSLAGYATFGPSRWHAHPYRGEIYELYLQPDYHGLGLGRRLFDSARWSLEKRHMQGIAVRALGDNTPARGFYEACGGRVIESGRERVGDKMFATVMYGWPAPQA